jgi:hypothetical protein
MSNQQNEITTARCCRTCKHKDIIYPDQPCGQCIQEDTPDPYTHPSKWEPGKDYRMPSDGA